MRLLSIGANHAGRRSSHQDATPHYRANQSDDGGQHLPLRDLSTNSPRDRARRRGDRMTLNLTRREAMKAGAAFVLGFYLPERVLANPSVSPDAGAFKANAWVRVTTDNRITLLTEIPEMGQGTRTANVMILADELEVEWSSIQWEQAPTIPAIYKHLITGGSSGMTATWLPMRQAGAQVREMLLTAAAQQWGVERKDCRAENGAVVHTPTQ